jgi:TM2 domain-containing membrane protein YozV/RNA polymerase subunit RPABC4/transcription elongation factor Spt4
MIRFACPKCHSVYEAPDDTAGKKVACDKCGQHLQIPAPQTSKTVLGDPLPWWMDVPPTAPKKDVVAAAAKTEQPPQPGPAQPSQARPPPLRKDIEVLEEIPEPPVEERSRRRRDDEDAEREKSPNEKYCHECGAIIRAKAAVCPECGVDQADVDERRKKFCHECGKLIRGKATVCPKCGVEQGSLPAHAGGSSGTGAGGSNRMAAGLLAILLGSLGIHKFILGYTTAGVIMLMVTIFGSCLYGAGWVVMSIIGLVEGIIYLSMSDKDFQRIHGRKTKPWF